MKTRLTPGITAFNRRACENMGISGRIPSTNCTTIRDSVGHCYKYQVLHHLFASVVFHSFPIRTIMHAAYTSDEFTYSYTYCCIGHFSAHVIILPRGVYRGLNIFYRISVDEWFRKGVVNHWRLIKLLNNTLCSPTSLSLFPSL